MNPQRRRVRLGQDELWVLDIWDDGRTRPRTYGPYTSFADLKADGRPLAAGRRSDARYILTPTQLPSTLLGTERSAYIDPRDLRDFRGAQAKRIRAARWAAAKRAVTRSVPATIAFVLGAVLLSPLWIPIAICFILLLPFILAYWAIEWAVRQLRG